MANDSADNTISSVVSHAATVADRGRASINDSSPKTSPAVRWPSSTPALPLRTTTRPAATTNMSRA